MAHYETRLLIDALLFENGHLRRTQHILNVYALTKAIGQAQRLSAQEQRIVQAAAILHDIAIGPCKAKYGDAEPQHQQQIAAPLVWQFLDRAGYAECDWTRIVELVEKHHEYDEIDGPDFQTLVEADLIANVYESEDACAKAKEVQPLFQTATGKALLSAIISHVQSLQDDDADDI